MLSIEELSPPADASVALPAEKCPISELNELMGWEPQKRRTKMRTRGLGSESRVKHLAGEKQRRRELSQVIQDIENLVPPEVHSKRSKIELLQNVAEYFRRVQETSLILMRENRNLLGFLQEREASAASVSSPRVDPPSSSASTQVLLVFGLLLFTFFAAPSLRFVDSLSASSPDASFSVSRHVLAFVPSSAPSPWRIAVGAFLMQVLIFLGGFVLLWSCILLRGMPSVATEKLAQVEQLLQRADEAYHGGNSGTADAFCASAYAMLALDEQSAALACSCCLFVQLLRALFIRCAIGLYWERAIVSLLTRRQVVFLSARAHALRCRIRDPKILQWSALRFVTSALTAASGYAVTNAEAPLWDELDRYLCMGICDKPSRFGTIRKFFLSAALSLASGLVQRRSSKAQYVSAAALVREAERRGGNPLPLLCAMKAQSDRDFVFASAYISTVYFCRAVRVLFFISLRYS